MPPNHYKLPEHESFVKAKYDEELILGWISSGFPPDILRGWIGHFHTVPLNVIQQASGKLQVTVDHSFPCMALPPPPPSSSSGGYVPFDPAQHSVNMIDTTKFQCTWGTFSQCYLIVANAPASKEAMVFDVDAAFGNVPFSNTHPTPPTVSHPIMNMMRQCFTALLNLWDGLGCPQNVSLLRPHLLT